MSQFADYLIVGAGVAGGHAAFEIRKRNKNGKIIMVTAEEQPPYDRVPMSKEYLAGKRKKSELFFRADSYFRRNKIELIREHYVKAINTPARLATMDDGSEIEYRVALLATGGRVRKLQLPGSDLAGIFYLRTLQECDAIRAASKTSKNVVIIGGGFIGCEFAAALRSKGLNVTLVELAPQLLGAAIDEKTASWIKDYHVRKGVKVLTSSSITGFQGRGGHLTGVELKGGKTINADFAVVGVG
ncbi:MAG TPA: NAD(P)/FAD-dependent oxidoreductase, partial [Nitrososphaerales archaeon]|nr:NAD(P)/FAD-dependent oxidoreductase [Nitrososphaerales archaeon]